MELNGKAKEDFNKWVIQEYPILRHINITEDKLFVSLSNALIIEWFDSVGIYIQIDCGNLKHDNTNNVYFQGGVLKNEFGSVFNTRKEATEEAIKKANEIYNKN